MPLAKFPHVVQARDIADDRVSLPAAPGEPAHVESSMPGKVWTVYNPSTEWACCTCNDGQSGNICSHQLKVISMIHPVSEAELVKRLGTFKGHLSGGLQHLQQAACDTPSAFSIDDEQPRLADQMAADGHSRRLHDEPAAPELQQQTCNPLQHTLEAAAVQPRHAPHIDRDSLRRKFEGILETASDDPDCLQVMQAELHSLHGRVQNILAHQQGSLPHPMAAAILEALPGSNSLLRWKPICETGSSKTMRKRQSAYSAAAVTELCEAPAEPLPLPQVASKKRSFRQQISAGVLAEQAKNTAAVAADQPTAPSRLSRVDKENTPPMQPQRASGTASLASLFRRKA